MISKLKFMLRRLAQKITGLDADNTEINNLRNKIAVLENELQHIKKDFLYNPRLIPVALENFKANQDFYNNENSLIAELENLGLLTSKVDVAELMSGAGFNAWHLRSKVKSYVGFDSSEVLINFSKKTIAEFDFKILQDQNLKEDSCDLVIIANRVGRWSKLSAEHFISIARKMIKPGGTIIVELPHADIDLQSKDFKFEKLRYSNLTFLIAKDSENNRLISNLN